MKHVILSSLFISTLAYATPNFTAVCRLVDPHGNEINKCYIGGVPFTQGNNSIGELTIDNCFIGSNINASADVTVVSNNELQVKYQSSTGDKENITLKRANGEFWGLGVHRYDFRDGNSISCGTVALGFKDRVKIKI
jgi:hypothetical protein